MLREWAEQLLILADSPWGPVILVSHAFLESFILPIAHDFFLIAVSLGKPEMSLLYALMSTVASTLGNIVGYNIGRIGGKPLIEKLIKAKTLHLTQQMLHKYDVWATAIASFTPFPDKVFSLCAGAFSLNFKRFTLAIFFARAARFYLVSFLLFFYGASLREILLDHMGTIMLGLLALILVSSIVWKYFLRWFEKKLD